MAASEDWLDEMLLSDDASRRAWKRRAVGMSTSDAMSRVPRTGQLNCRIPITEWRVVRAHCREQGVSLGMFMRHAIAARLISQGVDPATIPVMMRGPRERG
jgi:hypothetical protein